MSLGLIQGILLLAALAGGFLWYNSLPPEKAQPPVISIPTVQNGEGAPAEAESGVSQDPSAYLQILRAKLALAGDPRSKSQLIQGLRATKSALSSQSEEVAGILMEQLRSGAFSTEEAGSETFAVLDVYFEYRSQASPETLAREMSEFLSTIRDLRLKSSVVAFLRREHSITEPESSQSPSGFPSEEGHD